MGGYTKLIRQKILCLLRHSKSSWLESALADFDRPLSARGNRNASSLNKFLMSKNFVFDKILCSSARRTKETCLVALDGISGQDNTIFTDSLYMTSASTVINMIRSQDNDLNTILVVGHNPSMHEVLEVLTGKHLVKYPTGTFAVVRCSSKWENLLDNFCDLSWFLTPKHLEGLQS